MTPALILREKIREVIPGFGNPSFSSRKAGMGAACSMLRERFPNLRNLEIDAASGPTPQCIGNSDARGSKKHERNHSRSRLEPAHRIYSVREPAQTRACGRGLHAYVFEEIR